MEILDIRDIDFSKLEMLDIFSSESTLYFYDKLIYKLYDDLPLDTLKRKREKMYLLNQGENNFDAVIPSILIQNRDLMYGCAMEYIKNSKSLIKYKKSEMFILLLYAVSLSLKKIHSDPRNIVVGDLHFNNILIDEKWHHHFVDFDSVMIDGIKEDRLPRNLMDYVSNRGNFKYEVSPKTDKLCMFLSILNALFGKDIDSISMNEYDEKAETLYTLKNMRNLVLDVKNNSSGILEVPYLSELISIRDFPVTKKIRSLGTKKG